MDGSFDCRLSRETSYEVLFKASVHRRMKVTHSWRNNFRDLVRALLEAAQHSMMNEWFSSRRKKVYSQCAAQVAAIIADAGKKDTNCPTAQTHGKGELQLSTVPTLLSRLCLLMSHAGLSDESEEQVFQQLPATAFCVVTEFRGLNFAGRTSTGASRPSSKAAPWMLPGKWINS